MDLGKLLREMPSVVVTRGMTKQTEDALWLQEATRRWLHARRVLTLEQYVDIQRSRLTDVINLAGSGGNTLQMGLSMKGSLRKGGSDDKRG